MQWIYQDWILLYVIQINNYYVSQSVQFENIACQSASKYVKKISRSEFLKLQIYSESIKYYNIHENNGQSIILWDSQQKNGIKNIGVSDSKAMQRLTEPLTHLILTHWYIFMPSSICIFAIKIWSKNKSISGDIFTAFIHKLIIQSYGAPFRILWVRCQPFCVGAFFTPTLASFTKYRIIF